MFMENLLSPPVAGGIVRRAVVSYPVPARLRVAWLALQDLGAYAAAALRRMDLAGRAVDISGPELLDGPAIAEKVGRALGFPLAYSVVPPEHFERGLVPAVGETVARGIAKTYVWLAERQDTALFTETSNELRRNLTGSLTGLEAWASRQAWPAPTP
jgi:uncharacterized protein YbjT (DUF2867 family)